LGLVYIKNPQSKEKHSPNRCPGGTGLGLCFLSGVELVDDEAAQAAGKVFAQKVQEFVGKSHGAKGFSLGLHGDFGNFSAHKLRGHSLFLVPLHARNASSNSAAVYIVSCKGL